MSVLKYVPFKESDFLNPSVEGFEQIENNRVKILLSDNKYAIVHFTDLSEFYEEVYRYFNDQNYYHAEINSMLESFIAESEDLEIKEEE